jgi:hypothetical protein
MTPETRETEMDDLLDAFQRVCEDVTVAYERGSAGRAKYEKERASLRNDLRARLLSSNPPTPAPGGETMTPELKSCPFCGGRAHMTTLQAEDYTGENGWASYDSRYGVGCDEGCVDLGRSSTPTRTATDAPLDDDGWIVVPGAHSKYRYKRDAKGWLVADRDGFRGSLISHTDTVWLHSAFAAALNLISRLSSSPSSTTATPAMTLNEEPAACGYCSSADFREDDDQKFDAPAFGHRHLHSGCRNEIVMAIRATMGFEQASSSAPDYRRQVTMSESTVRDYHRLREALGVGPGVSFDHCITLVRQYVYYGKNPPDAEQIADQCRLPLRRTLSDEALRAVVRDGDKSIGESLDALNELNRRSGCALPSSRALSEEEQDRLSHIRLAASLADSTAINGRRSTKRCWIAATSSPSSTVLPEPPSE